MAGTVVLCFTVLPYGVQILFGILVLAFLVPWLTGKLAQRETKTRSKWENPDPKRGEEAFERWKAEQAAKDEEREP